MPACEQKLVQHCYRARHTLHARHRVAHCVAASFLFTSYSLQWCILFTHVRTRPGQRIYSHKAFTDWTRYLQMLSRCIDGRILKFCADQLSGVRRHLFQASIDHYSSLWKMSTIIPVPKKSTPKQLSDLRPVALTSRVLKTLETFLKSLILSAVEPMLDPFQFA